MSSQITSTASSAPTQTRNLFACIAEESERGQPTDRSTGELMLSLIAVVSSSAVGRCRHGRIEAALIGTLAGILGGTLGLIAVIATAIGRRWTPTIEPSLLLAAPVIGVLTGTLAGLAPALKAARTPPAETLRSQPKMVFAISSGSSRLAKGTGGPAQP